MKLYPYWLASLLLLPFLPLQAADTQQQQQALQRDIRQLSKNLQAQKGESTALQDEVTQLEKKLGNIADKYRKTEKKIEATLDKLQAASIKKLKLERDLNEQKAGLAQQLQASYSAGEQSHLRLLLRQDEPADISRTMRYFEYLNKNRLERIRKVEGTLKEISAVHAAIEKDRNELQALTKALEQQKADIETTLKARATALAAVKSDIRITEKQLNKLKADEAALQATLDKLAAKAAARAAAKQEQVKAIGVHNSSNSTKPEKNTGITKAADKSAQSDAVVSSFTSDRAFSTLRGKLSWPVNGRIIHSYDSVRNEKQRWKGVVLAAPGGTKVRAVARGRVAFAGWMDGYGHLIIIEHDSNYMSLYGYNRAVYKKEGEMVNANEVIAAVGNSSGQSQDALYFEIRQDTSPQNPARWCR